MTSVQQLLDEKGHEVHTIHPEETVLDAIQEMAAENVGALMVMEGNVPVGIFTERHYARNVFLKGKSSPECTVDEAMERSVIYVTPRQTVEDCMALMTNKFVRHLPVMENGALVGIVSIGDLVKSIIADQRFTIQQMTHYIQGSR